jgi:hypothetical protein
MHNYLWAIAMAICNNYSEYLILFIKKMTAKIITFQDLDECFPMFNRETGMELLSKMEAKLDFNSGANLLFENQFWDCEEVEYYNEESKEFESPMIKKLTEEEFICSIPIENFL